MFDIILHRFLFIHRRDNQTYISMWQSTYSFVQQGDPDSGHYNCLVYMMLLHQNTSFAMMLHINNLYKLICQCIKPLVNLIDVYCACCWHYCIHVEWHRHFSYNVLLFCNWTYIRKYPMFTERLRICVTRFLIRYEWTCYRSPDLLM